MELGIIFVILKYHCCFALAVSKYWFNRINVANSCQSSHCLVGHNETRMGVVRQLRAKDARNRRPTAVFQVGHSASCI